MASTIENKYVISKLDSEYYGIPIENVLSIEKIIISTRIPNTPDYITGAINLRGEVVPVIDLRSKLGMKLKEMDDDSRIIIVKVDDIVAGLIVDSSSEVLEIENNNIDMAPTTDNNKFIEYINGIGKTSDKLVILLNLTKILEY